MKNNRFLVFILFVVALSLMAYSKFTDLGDDPSKVKVKRVITVQYKLKKGDFLYDKFKGWTMDGKYIMIVEEDEGNTLLYDKEGRYFKKLEGVFWFSSYTGNRILTVKDPHHSDRPTDFYIYDTRNYKLVKKFRSSWIDGKDRGVFYDDNSLLIVKNKFTTGKVPEAGGWYKVKIFRFNYMDGKEEVIYEAEVLGATEDIMYFGDGKIYYSRDRYVNGEHRGEDEYVYDIKTGKESFFVKDGLRYGWDVYFLRKGLFVYEDNYIIRDIKTLKELARKGKRGKPYLDKKYIHNTDYSYIEWYDGTVLPNLKLYILDIGTFNESIRGDYPMDSYIYLYTLDMKKRKMLKLKSPTTLDGDRNYFSPEGDRFVAMQDYKRFVIIVLERKR